MQPLSQPSPKTFNLLSIGQRGVGKTVFLAGSYAQLQANASAMAVKTSLTSGGMHPSKLRLGIRQRIDRSSPFWFECQDEDVQANLARILLHIGRTGLYPPATIKITNFNFQLKQRTAQGIETVCNFRWSDIPGESCNLRNEEFQEIVITSHACCVFINAQALIHDPSYAPTLQDIFNQVIVLASLVQQHRLQYAIALVLTQCDLLEAGDATQLETKLQPLIRRLSDIKVNYRLFYSAIPIETIEGHFTLKAKGTADPLLWLLTELNKRYRSQPERNLASGFAQNQARQRRFSPRLGRFIVVLTLTGISLLGIGILLLFELDLVKKTPKPLPTQEQRSP